MEVKEEVTSFKYQGATLYKDSTYSAQILIRIASAMAAMARFNQIWQSNITNFTSKFKLYKSLVTSISSSTAVKHEPCLLTLKKRIQAFETKCMRKLLHISYLEHKTNDWVRSMIWQLSKDGNLHGSGMSHARQPLPSHPSRYLGGWVTP